MKIAKQTLEVIVETWHDPGGHDGPRSASYDYPILEGEVVLELTDQELQEYLQDWRDCGDEWLDCYVPSVAQNDGVEYASVEDFLRQSVTYPDGVFYGKYWCIYKQEGNLITVYPKGAEYDPDYDPNPRPDPCDLYHQKEDL